MRRWSVPLRSIRGGGILIWRANLTMATVVQGEVRLHQQSTGSRRLHGREAHTRADGTHGRQGLRAQERRRSDQQCAAPERERQARCRQPGRKEARRRGFGGAWRVRL